MPRPGQQLAGSSTKVPARPHAHVVLPAITCVAPELRECSRRAGSGQAASHGRRASTLAQRCSWAHQQPPALRLGGTWPSSLQAQVMTPALSVA